LRVHEDTLFCLGQKSLGSPISSTPSQKCVVIFQGSSFANGIQKGWSHHPQSIHLYTRPQRVVLLLRAPQRTRYLVISGSGARSAANSLFNQSSRRMKLDSTLLRRVFFLESGYARPLVSLALRSPRQNRSIPWSALRKNSPAASTASMANMRA